MRKTVPQEEGDNMRSLMKEILESLFRAILLAPLGGALIGTIVAAVGFLTSGYGFVPSFAASFGIPFGGLFGLAFGILTAWPLRRERLGNCVAYLAGSTLAFALPCALIPELGVPLSWLAGLVGYWVGFFLLKRRAFGEIALSPPAATSDATLLSTRNEEEEEEPHDIP